MSNVALKSVCRPALRLVVLATALSFGGCMTAMDYEKIATPYVPNSPAERYPITVSDTRVSMEVPVHRRMSRLPADVRSDVQRFLAQYSAAGSGRLYLVKPRRARHSTSMAVTIAELRRMISLAGIDAASVAMVNYPKGAAGTTAPVTLWFETLVAISPECGDWSENLAITYSNTPQRNFGCAAQNNLAAMVANPSDLVTPRSMTPKHARRRDVIMEQYRVGGKTEADTSKSEDINLSEVGNE